MYRQIVVATDGSEIAGRAVDHAIKLAAEMKAKLSAVTVSEPFEIIAADTSGFGIVPPVDYEQHCADEAARLFTTLEAAAGAAGVTCTTVHRIERWPYKAIIDEAEKIGADLVVMGSHGRRGIEGLLLGSQAVKLLTHTKIPVLVIR